MLFPVSAYVSFQHVPQFGELKEAGNPPPMKGKDGKLAKVVNPMVCQQLDGTRFHSRQRTSRDLTILASGASNAVEIAVRVVVELIEADSSLRSTSVSSPRRRDSENGSGGSKKSSESSELHVQHAQKDLKRRIERIKGER